MSAGRRASRRYPRSRAARLAVPLAVPMALGLTLGIILGVSGGTQHTSIQQAPQANTSRLASVPASSAVTRPPGHPGRDGRPVSGSGYAVEFPGVAAEVTEMSGAGTVAGSTNELPSGPALTAWCSALPLR